MRIFSSVYNKITQWSKHQKAPYYLASVSFAESSFFPIPPDFMLIPMIMAKPQRAWSYAGITTLFSILGGIFGYFIGAFFFLTVGNKLVETLGYQHEFSQVVAWFKDYGVWAVILAAFTPIPYKIFTIAAGVTGMPLIGFVTGSIVGRGGRFFLVAILAKLFERHILDKILDYIDIIGWVTVAAIVLILIWLKFV